MKEIAENDGITSFKVYTTYDDMLTDDEIFQVLKEAKGRDSDRSALRE